MGNGESLAITVVLHEGAFLPCYATAGSAGADLRAYLPHGSVTVETGHSIRIPTGLELEIPRGFEGQVRPRSGLAARYGITVLNSPGTIDSDYRGEVHVVLVNLGNEPFTVSHGDRIAQLVIAPVTNCRFIVENETSPTERGNRGFGSTGV